MQTERLTWVDAAKGIGIFLVFLGHTALPYPLFIYLFSFHMPLFFFLSGYLYRPGKHNSWWDFLKSKFKKLIIPYALFFAILFIYWILIGRAIGDIQNLNVKISTIFYEFFYASAYLKTPFAPLWFLLTLFWVELIFFFLQNNITKKFWLFLSLILISLIGYFYGLKMNVRPPWGLDIALVAVLLYGLGHFAKAFKVQLSHISKFLLILVVPILVLIGWRLALVNGQVDMMANYYGTSYLFLPAALVGIGATVILAKIWPNRLFQYLGRNSLFLFAFQFAALDIGKTLTRFFWPNLNLAVFGGQNIILGLGLTIFALGLLALILEIYNLLKKKPLAS